jgi:hypothetical protein
VRHVRMLMLCIVAAFVVAAAVASSALAGEITNPTTKTSIFDNCPTEATEGQLPNGEFRRILEPASEWVNCVWSSTEAHGEGGHFKVGNLTVPFSKQVVLQFGDGISVENGEEVELYIPPLHGAPAIAPTPELVPAEPIAHISAAEQTELEWPESLKYSYAQAQKHHLVKKVYETIEIAGIPHTSRNAILEKKGTGVLAPVKVKGENAWISQLGDVCYIGSDAEPIVQHLTDAASTSPLTGETVEGSTGELKIMRGGEEVALTHSVLLDNTYAVPGASCSGPYSQYIQATIDKIFGIPAVAGASITEITGTLYTATPSIVR